MEWSLRGGRSAVRLQNADRCACRFFFTRENRNRNTTCKVSSLFGDTPADRPTHTDVLPLPSSLQPHSLVALSSTPSHPTPPPLVALYPHHHHSSRPQHNRPPNPFPPTTSPHPTQAASSVTMTLSMALEAGGRYGTSREITSSSRTRSRSAVMVGEGWDTTWTTPTWLG
jgi:hypothetical protein